MLADALLTCRGAAAADSAATSSSLHGNLRFQGVSHRVKARAKTGAHIDDLPVEQVPQRQIREGCRTKEVAQAHLAMWKSDGTESRDTNVFSSNAPMLKYF